MDARFYHILLSMIAGLGPRRLAVLNQALGSPEKVWCGSEKDLLAVPGIPRKVIDELLTKRKRLNPEKEVQKLRDQGIKILFSDEPVYPPRLQHIFDPPGVLYLKGNPDVLQKPMLAIVGARKASYYGTAVAENIARDITRAGLVVVSGMARGIDTAAHRGALGVSGQTVAVLGCGVDVIYPRENRRVMAEIIEQGAVISEFPPGTAPVAGNFPQRNRLISGLSEGVLIIEAAEKSGSLITADMALEQGRDVFAVPGQVTNPLNRGTHRLIKQGARLVEDAGDILEELGLKAVAGTAAGSEDASAPEQGTGELTPSEKKVYGLISENPVTGEMIIKKTGLGSAEVLSLLVILEIKGLIRQLTGQRYIRCP